MMTREQYMKALMTIAAHDAEQREQITLQAQEIARLREALQLLHDHQNGCPLPKYEKDWNRAMELTEQILKEQS